MTRLGAYFLVLFGRFSGGCIGIVYPKSLFWHLFSIDFFFTYQKKKKIHFPWVKKNLSFRIDNTSVDYLGFSEFLLVLFQWNYMKYVQIVGI